jgi:hypothetical protein
MTKTSVSKQFIKKYSKYKEYADFMDILDSSEKPFINQSKYVLKLEDDIRRLLKFGKEIPEFNNIDNLIYWRESTDYLRRLFYTFLEWVEKDIFLREDGMGEYDYYEIDGWESLFDLLNPQTKYPIKRTKYFSIVKDVERKQLDNYVKQIKDKLEEKKTKTEKLNLLHKLKMAEQYKHYPTLIDWIDDTIYLIKNGRYEDATTDIEGNLNLTEIQILLKLFVNEGLFPDLFNPSKTVAEKKIRLFFSKLFNKPESSFKKPMQKVRVEDKELTNNQIVPRIMSLKKINSMLSNIADAEGINDIIEKIESRIVELENKIN